MPLGKNLNCRINGKSSKKSPIEKIDRIFSPHPLTGPEGVPPAPAYPLILYDVDYPYEFQCDPKACVRHLFLDFLCE